MRLLHPLFALLASVTKQELARQVAYLKAENRILRARLPKRIVRAQEVDPGWAGSWDEAPGPDLDRHV